MKTKTQVISDKRIFQSGEYHHLKIRKQFIFLSFLALVLFASTSSFAQTDKTTSVTENNLLIKGKVSDDEGFLPGANIILKNTSIGAVSDENGQFIFPKTLTKGDVLLVSYLGYKNQEILIDGKTNRLDILLELDSLDVVHVAPNNDKPYRSNRKK